MYRWWIDPLAVSSYHTLWIKTCNCRAWAWSFLPLAVLQPQCASSPRFLFPHNWARSGWSWDLAIYDVLSSVGFLHAQVVCFSFLLFWKPFGIYHQWVVLIWMVNDGQLVPLGTVVYEYQPFELQLINWPLTCFFLIMKIISLVHELATFLINWSYKIVTFTP